MDAFNATLGAEEQPVSLSSLDSFTYFLIQAPGCPGYFEYAGNSYSNGVLAITLNEFFRDDVGCPAVDYQEYAVFKAHKV